MKPIVFHPRAEEELAEAVAYDESRRAGLGAEFQEQVESLVWLIRGDPERWPLHQQTSCRKASLDRYPYNLFDLDLDDRIWIAAIAHQKRKPGYWKRRQPGGGSDR